MSLNLNTDPHCSKSVMVHLAFNQQKQNKEDWLAAGRQVTAAAAAGNKSCRVVFAHSRLSFLFS
jgi:hypothetical protein